MMTVSEMQVLSETVTLYETQGGPVTPAGLAAEMEAETETIRTCFDDFESNYLLKQTEGGYRPTVTAHELLELDLEHGDLVILDTEPER
ncbi:MAG: hypothetical protein V5A55_04420 [Halovenus sp.]